MNKILNEPFRLFFPLGILYLIFSMLVWFPLAFFKMDYYPTIMHHYLVLDGFLFSFIGGFLMTAVCRFLKSLPSTKWEVGLYAILPIMGLKFALNESSDIYYISLLQSLFLLKFVIVRVKYRVANPPASFIFLPIGIITIAIMSLAGALDYSFFNISLFILAPVSLLILAIGAKIIPAILGHSSPVVDSSKTLKLQPLLKQIDIKFATLGMVFLLSFLEESMRASFIQLQIILYFQFKYLKTFKFPKNKTSLSYSIWLSCHILTLGFFIKLVWPDGSIHALHIIFIGVFLLLSMLISIRVLVSHSKSDASLENVKSIYFISFLLVFAMTTRILAFLIDGLYESHLGYAAFLVILAVLVWSYKFGKLVFKFK